MHALLKRLRRDESGAAGVEYGILVAAVAAAIVVSAFSIGGAVSNAFDYTAQAITDGCKEPTASDQWLLRDASNGAPYFFATVI